MNWNAGRVRWTAAVAVVGALALSTTVFAASAGHSRSPRIVAPPSSALERSIAASWQGVQVDVWDGGAPSPGRTTTMLVHRGQRALQLYWTTDGWCVARAFTWDVEHARGRNSFDVRYTTDQKDTDCLMDEGDTVRYRVAEAGTTNGRATWTGMYVQPNGQWSQRTQCSTQWDAARPCGFADAGALIARTWPAG